MNLKLESELILLPFSASGDASHNLWERSPYLDKDKLSLLKFNKFYFWHRFFLPISG
jgi:hypothetical protein